MTLPFDTTLIHLLNRCTQSANAVYKSANTRNLHTPRHYILLATIHENQGLTQTEIVGRSGIDRSTTTALIRRMVSAKLAVRRRDVRDTRAYVVKLTPLGEKTLFELHEIMKDVDEKLLAGIRPKARAELLTTLTHVASITPASHSH